MTARDIRYGRQGGRLVPWEHTQAERPPDCEVCGQPVYAHTGPEPARHRTCDARPELDGQGTLL